MLQRFKITSCMFILFSIGLLLTGVSPVIAQDQNLYLAERGWDHSFGCLQRELQITTRAGLPHNVALGKCARQRAREIESVISNYNKSNEGAPADPSGGEVARLNAKVTELETQVSAANAAQEPLNAKVAELETQVSAANAAQEPLNAKVAELETQVSAANAAQEPLNAKVTELETQVSAANTAQEPLNAKIEELEGANAMFATTVASCVKVITKQKTNHKLTVGMKKYILRLCKGH